MEEEKGGIKLPRVVNKRIIPLFALIVTATILLRYVTGISLIGGIVLRVLFAGGLSALGLVFFFRDKRKTAFLILALLVVGLSTGISYDVRLKTYHTFLPESGVEHTVSGYVDTRAVSYDEVQSVTLASLTVNGKAVDGKIRLYFNDTVSIYDLPQGSRIEAKGLLYAVMPIDGKSVDATSFRKDIRYRMSVQSDAFRIVEGAPGGLAAIRLTLYDRLISALGVQYGTVAYGMLTGDKSELDETTLRLYNLSGIGHILAVSGLHIGLLAALIMVLLEKCRVPRTVRAVVTFCALLVYAAFVGFTASVLRAVIMCGVTMIVFLCGARKDTLSTLSLAFCLILLISPLSLFEVGFLMSFAAVFGLALFYRPFHKALTKIKLPKFVSAPLATTTAVQVGIAPIAGYFFGGLQTYSVLFNLLLIPVLTLTFAVLVFLLPLVFLFSVPSLLRLAGVGLAFVDSVVGIVPMLPINTIPVFAHAALFLLYPLYFAASRFLLVPRGKCAKRLTALGLTVCCVAIAAIPTAVAYRPNGVLKGAMIPVDAYGDVTTIFVQDTVTVVGDLKRPYALKTALQTLRLRAVDTILLNGLDEATGRALYDFTQEVRVGRIVCPLDRVDAAGLATLGRYDRFFLWEEVEIPFITQVTVSGKHLGYVYRFSDAVQVLVTRKNGDYRSAPAEVLNQTAIIRCMLYQNDIEDRVYITNLPRGYLGHLPRYQYATADDGLFVYKPFTGEVLKGGKKG